MDRGRSGTCDNGSTLQEIADVIDEGMKEKAANASETAEPASPGM